MGRVLRTTLLTGEGGVVHLFVVYGYQRAEEDADQLQLTDKLLQAVLAEAQEVCVGQPMPIAGDLNGVLVLLLMLLVGLVGRRVLAHVVISLSAVPMLLLHLMLFMSLIGGSLLTFQFLLAFALVPGWLMLLAWLYASLFGLLVGWTLLIGPPRRLLVLSRMSGRLLE